MIRDKLLEPRFAAEYESGDLPEQAAYALAQMPPIMQTTIAELCAGKPTPPGWRLEKIKGEGMDHYLTTTAKCPDGDGCTNGKRFLAHDLDTKDLTPCCSKGCCVDCYHSSTCRHLCPAAKEKVSTERARSRETEKRERELTKKRDASIKDFWLEFGKRLNVACDGDVGILRAAIKKADAAGLLREPNMWRYAIESFSFNVDGTGFSCVSITGEDLAALCRQLNVSADYLLGLSDAPLFQAAGSQKTGDRKGG